MEKTAIIQRVFEYLAHNVYEKISTKDKKMNRQKVKDINTFLKKEYNEMIQDTHFFQNLEDAIGKETTKIQKRDVEKIMIDFLQNNPF